MNATIDLDDAEGLLAADVDGSLQGASMAGGQVRAVATAVAEGALDPLGAQDRARAVIWVAGRGTAGYAGAVLAGVVADAMSVPFVIASRAPLWVGPLDVMVIAGDDAGDPSLAAAVALGTRRGTRVVIAAPDEGPLADSGAGRAISLAPRLRVPDPFGLAHHLAVGAAVVGAVDGTVLFDLMTIADEIDGEVSRNAVMREVFTNAAKALASRLSAGPAVFCGDRAATVALAQHSSATLLRLAQRTAAASGLAEALAATRDPATGGGSNVPSLFHDEFIDGPRGDEPPRILALATDADVEIVTARIEGVETAELVATTDLGGATTRPVELAQAMMLAVRLQMAAVYVRLGAGRPRT